MSKRGSDQGVRYMIADDMGSREREAIECLPHLMGCFEIYAEESIERGVSQTGEGDEILPSGMDLMTFYHLEMVEGTAPCNCPTDDEGDDETEPDDE